MKSRAKKLQLSALDWLLVLVSLTVFAGAGALYFGEVPLRKYILGWDDELHVERVGELGESIGTVRTKSANDGEFISKPASSPLYNLDTVVTGGEGGATILLDDGSTIDLGPRTMVRLAFEDRLTLGGVSRARTVDVVAGQVSGQSQGREIVLRTRNESITIQKSTPKQTLKAPPPAPPQRISRTAPPPIPTPTPPAPEPEPSIAAEIEKSKESIVILSPRSGESFALPQFSTQTGRTVSVKWKMESKPFPVRLSVRLVSSEKPVMVETISPSGGVTTRDVRLRRPGEYTLYLEPVDSSIELEKKAEVSFVVPREFVGIEVIDPLVAGSKTTSNQFTGTVLESFDITLRWKPRPGVKDYQIRLFRNEKDTKPILERKLSRSQYVLNKDRIYAGVIYYRVFGEEKNGFIATSPLVPFRFDFLPPSLVLPEDGEAMSRADLLAKDGKILFTWRKTNFTKEYEVEIYRDKDFSSLLTSKRTKENFLVIDTPTPGDYFWRVTSRADGGLSSPSPGRRIRVTP